jgi:hypothetical protein
MVQGYLVKFKSATRNELDNLLQGKLSDALTREDMRVYFHAMRPNQHRLDMLLVPPLLPFPYHNVSQRDIHFK